MIKRIITLIIVFCLVFQQAGFSQAVGPIIVPAAMTGFAAADKFRPVHLRSVSFEAGADNLHIILDKGDLKDPGNDMIEDSTRSLLQYFFVGLALPNESFWVNLRPDSPDNIIDDRLSVTDVGRIMLEADVQLKKDTAKYTSPRSPEGRQYWNKLYQKAEELFGEQDISIPTVTRPWIVPGEIILRQTDHNAYIYKATLKVMLEADYLKSSSGDVLADDRLKILNDYSSQLIREMVLPKLTRDVNTSRRYAGLRQVYYSLILAQWFKDKYNNDPAWNIDSKDLTNFVSGKKWDKNSYFNEYRRSFREGEYNIEENIRTPYGLTIRQYFSGGIKFGAEMPIASGDMTAVSGNPLIKIITENTLAADVQVGPGNQYKIENIEMGASRSGDHPSVKASSPDAPVFSARDGGAESKDGSTYTSDALFSLALREARDGYPMGRFRQMAAVANSMAETVQDKAMIENLAAELEGMLSGRTADTFLAQDYIILYKVLVTAGLDARAGGIFEETLRILARLGDDFERLAVSDLLVEELLRAGWKEKVSKVYDSILTVGEDDKWGFIDDNLIMSRAGALAAMGRPDISRGVMVGIKSHRLDLKAEVLARVALMLVLAGDIAQGRLVCAEALAVARQRGNFQAKVGVFVDCAEVYAEAGMFEEAGSLCQDVYLLQLDSYVDEGYVVRIAKIYARMGKTEKALGFLGSVHNQGSHKELLLSIASEFLKNNNIKEALPLLRELDFKQPEGLALLAKAMRGSGVSITLPDDFFGRGSNKGIINRLLQKFGAWLIDSRFLAKLVAIGLSRDDIAEINRDIEALSIPERSAFRKEIITLAEELALSKIAAVDSREILKRVIYPPLPVPSEKKIQLSVSLRRTIALMRQAKVPVSARSHPDRPFGQILDELTCDENRREGLTDNFNLIIPRLIAANLPPEYIGEILWYIADKHPAFFKENISKPYSFTRLAETADAFLRRFGMPPDKAAQSLYRFLVVRDGLDAAYNLITAGEKAGLDQEQLKEMIELLPWLTRTDQEKVLITKLSREDEGAAFLRRLAFVNRARGSFFAAHDILSKDGKREFFLSLTDPAIIGLIDAVSDVPLKKDNKYAINFIEDVVRKNIGPKQSATLLRLINKMKETNVPRELIIPVMNWQIMDDGVQEASISRLLRVLPLLDEATKKQVVFIALQLGEQDSSELFIDSLAAAKGDIYGLLSGLLENHLSPDQPAHAQMLGLLENLFVQRGTFAPNQEVMSLFMRTFAGERHDEARDLLLADIITDWIAHNMVSDTPELQEAILAVKSGKMDPDNRMHQLANYRILRFEGSRNLVSREFSFKDYLEMLDKARKGETLEKAAGNISEKEERNVRGLVYEAAEIREKVIMALARQAAEDGRKLVVVGNLSYGGVALAPITEEKNGDTFIAGTDIPVWYTKVGSTESHNDELVFVKKLFTDDQLRLLAGENPYVVVVDASTSVSDPQRTSPHIPDGFKGYRNFFMALDYAMFNAVHPEDFYEDQEFAQRLLTAPGVKELISRLQAMNIKPRAPNPFSFRFWYERNESSTKEGSLYLRVNKKKDIKAPKVDISTINSPTCVFVQSAIHPEDVSARVKNEFIKGEYTPGDFDDKDHFRKFYLGYEEGFGLVASRQFVNLSRRLFRKYQAWEGEAAIAPAKPVAIGRNVDTVVLDLDGTIAKTDKKPSLPMARMINSLLKSGKDIVIITEDIEANVDARLADIDKVPGLTIFSDSGAKGYSYDASRNKVYFQEYNDKSRLPEGLREKVLAKASAFQSDITWEQESRVLRASPDYRIEFRNVSDRKTLISWLETMLAQEGVTGAEVYTVGRTSVKIVLQHKEQALKYFLGRKPQDKSKILIIADAVRSHQPDRKMLTAFPEAINVNVGSYSPTIARENPNIIQCDKAGIAATGQFLFPLAQSNKIPASLLNGSGSTSRKDGGKLNEFIEKSSSGKVVAVDLQNTASYSIAVNALKEGKVVRLDLSHMRVSEYTSAKEIDEHFAMLNKIIAKESGMSRSRESLDSSFAHILADLLDNALLHGNKLDVALPIFMKGKFTDSSGWTSFEIYDTAREKELSAQERKLAYAAGLGGNHDAIKWIKNFYQYQKTILPDKTGTRVTVSRYLDEDGGYITIDALKELEQNLNKAIETRRPENIQVWLDIDNTTFDHKLKSYHPVFYQTQNFVSTRLKQISATMSPDDFRLKQKTILETIIKECVFWEQKWLEAAKLEKVEGIKELLVFAARKGIKVNLVTNRPDDPDLRAVTGAILDSLDIKQFTDYSDIIFVGAGNGKAKRIEDNINAGKLVFFVDNNDQYVADIAAQLKDRHEAGIFHLDRSNHEGKFTYEELKDEAARSVAAGLKNTRDRAEATLFLGCAALEINTLAQEVQASKIAELRSLMDKAGGALDRTYIDSCLVDIERGFEFQMDLSQYPQFPDYLRKNVDLYKAHQDILKAYILKQIKANSKQLGMSSGDAEQVQRIRVEFRKYGQFKDIFKVTAALLSGKSVDLCLVIFKNEPISYLSLDRHQAEEDLSKFEAEAKLKIELASLAQAQGLPVNLVPVMYDTGVSQSGPLHYYLQEWIDGPTIAEIMKTKFLQADELERIAESWMTIGRVTGEYVNDPHAENMMKRPDGSLVIIDLGEMRRLVPPVNEADIILNLFKDYNQQTQFEVYEFSGMGDSMHDRILEPAVMRRAMLSGMKKGLGPKWEGFCREALKSEVLDGVDRRSVQAFLRAGAQSEESMSGLVNRFITMIRGLKASLRNDTWEDAAGLIEECKKTRSELIAIGPAVIEHLLPYLRDRESKVKAQVALVLGRIGTAEVIQPLIWVVLNDRKDTMAVNAAMEGLALANEPAVAALSELLDNQDPDIANDAAVYLGKIASPRTVEALIAHLEGHDTRMICNVALALIEINDSRGLAALDDFIEKLEQEKSGSLTREELEKLKKRIMEFNEMHRIMQNGKNGLQDGGVISGDESRIAEKVNFALGGTPEILRGEELCAAINSAGKAFLPWKKNFGTYKRIVDTGAHVFDAYEEYLSEEGLKRKKIFDELREAFRNSDSGWEQHFDTFLGNIDRIPRISDNLDDLHPELFKDVFPGMSPEQIKAFIQVGKNIDDRRSILYLVLTQGCSNQCLICGIRGADEGKVKFGKQMPFPFAVKIMKAVADPYTKLVPYRDSDPLDYFDGPSGATIADILFAAQKLGFTRNGIVTHGSNYRRQQSPAVMSRIAGKFAIGISLHLYHGSVFAFARDFLDPDKKKAKNIMREREEIIERYSGRYASLLKSVSSSDKDFEVRVFDDREILRFFEDRILTSKKWETAHRTLSKEEVAAIKRAHLILWVMNYLQADIWKKTQIKLGTDVDFYKSNYSVVWIGKAAALLRRMGVPEDVIASIQETAEQKMTLSRGPFDSVVGVDGVPFITSSDDPQRISRTVGEAFPDPAANEFKRFLKFARAIVKAEDVSDLLRPVYIDDDDIKRHELEKYRKHFAGSTPNVEDYDVADVLVRHDYSPEIAAFLNMAPAGAKELLLLLDDNVPVSDETAAELHRLLENMPFQVETYFSMIPKKSYLANVTKLEKITDDPSDYIFKYSFVPPGNKQALQRDIFNPYRKYPVIVHAPVSKDGGAVREILKQNLNAISVGEQGVFGTVVDAKKAWKIFREKDNGEIGALSREFARQIAMVKGPDFEEHMVKDVVNNLNEESVMDKEIELYISVTERGAVEGMIRMHVPKLGVATVTLLWVAPEVQRAGKRIGTGLLDTFFRLQDERGSREALIYSLPEAANFYRIYLGQKGMTPIDYKVSKADNTGYNFKIPYKSIKRIVHFERFAGDSERRDGGIEFVMDFATYPLGELYRQKNMEAYKAQEEELKEYILQQVRTYGKNLGIDGADSVPVRSIRVKYAAKGGYKDVFKVIVSLSTKKSVPLCLVVLRPNRENYPDGTRPLSDIWINRFKAEVEAMRSIAIAAEAQGAPGNLVPALYAAGVSQSGELRYYLREWIDGPAVADIMKTAVLQEDDLEHIAQSWMTLGRVSGMYATDLNAANIILRPDGSLTAVDLGGISVLNSSFNEAGIVFLLFNIYGQKDALPVSKVRGAILAGMKKGLGPQWEGFINNALVSSLLPGSYRKSIELFLQESGQPDLAADGGMGGIDLRKLPVSVARGQAADPAMEKSPELDDQWQKIQDMVNKGLLPETAMIKEYLQSCRQAGKVPTRTDRVLSCIADIFRLEEDCCQPTDPALKELATLLE